jgi:hypothetical protein
MRINKYSDFTELETIHIFIYYDIPLFFISKSSKDEYFLNYYIEELENKTDKWLFSRISNRERLDLIEKRLSTLELLNRLLKKERLYHIFINPLMKGNDTTLKSELVITNENFDLESFPEDDFYVSYDYVSKKELIKVEEDIIDNSIFKMVLNDQNNSHDISLDLFLNTMSNLKKSLSDIATDIGSNIFDRQTAYPINLRIDSLQPSSFGIIIKTEPQDGDLFGVPEKSLNNLFEIIEDIRVKNLVELKEQIEIDESISINTIKSLKNLLKEISDNEFSLKLEAKTKSKRMPKEAIFDKSSYNKLDILNDILKDKSDVHTEILEIKGVLISINSSRNWFRISTDTIGEIGGKMSQDIFKKLNDDKNYKFRVPSAIKATVEKKIINDYLENGQSEKYTLIYYEQP